MFKVTEEIESGQCSSVVQFVSLYIYVCLIIFMFTSEVLFLTLWNNLSLQLCILNLFFFFFCIQHLNYKYLIIFNL